VSQSSEFATLILCVASQRVVPKVSLYFVIDSVRKLLDAPSYIRCPLYILGREPSSVWKFWQFNDT